MVKSVTVLRRGGLQSRWARGILILVGCCTLAWILLAARQGGQGEAEEARWLHRRLAKGEPSGDEGTKVQPSGDEGTEEREDVTSRLIKISVTLSPRGTV